LFLCKVIGGGWGRGVNDDERVWWHPHAAWHGDRPSFGLKMQDLGQLVHEPALYQIFSVVTLQSPTSFHPFPPVFSMSFQFIRKVNNKQNAKQISSSFTKWLVFPYNTYGGSWSLIEKIEDKFSNQTSKLVWGPSLVIRDILDNFVILKVNCFFTHTPPSPFNRHSKKCIYRDEVLSSQIKADYPVKTGYL
jgi:hypothetical protein